MSTVTNKISSRWMHFEFNMYVHGISEDAENDIETTFDQIVANQNNDQRLADIFQDINLCPLAEYESETPSELAKKIIGCAVQAHKFSQAELAEQRVKINGELNQLAEFYENHDINQAINLYAQASAHGDLPSMVRLSDIYWEGNGIEQDDAIAIALLKLAGNEPQKLQNLIDSASPEDISAADQVFSEISQPGNFIRALYDHLERKYQTSQTEQIDTPRG